VRILLDACVPERLGRFIAGHDVLPVRVAFGTTDLDDGPLLARAVASGFEAFVTVDKSLRYQQNLGDHPLRVVLLRAHSNALEHLVPLVPTLQTVLSEMEIGTVRVIGV
jgi:predicted nuclease of predicted toxin-antitoxin system